MRYQEVQYLARAQHGVATREQLLAIGFSRPSLKHQIKTKRLFPVHRGVYAIGRENLTQEGYWMAAVLSCGPRAVLSHQCAGRLWQLTKAQTCGINISVPEGVNRARPGVTLHRRGPLTFQNVTHHLGIPVTNPAATLVDLATVLSERQLEAAINEADKRGLISSAQLTNLVEEFSGWRGVGPLRSVLDKATLVLTDSELERKFLHLVKAAGLPDPETGVMLNRFKVDFLWRSFGLIVETDGLHYHRTPTQQVKDRTRDQAHTSLGFTTLRFTHYQVAHEPEYVGQILCMTMNRLAGHT